MLRVAAAPLAGSRRVLVAPAGRACSKPTVRAMAQQSSGGNGASAGRMSEVMGSALPPDRISKVWMTVKGRCSMGISHWPAFSFTKTGREKPPDEGVVTGVRGSVLQVDFNSAASSSSPGGPGGPASSSSGPAGAAGAQQAAEPRDTPLGARLARWVPLPGFSIRTHELQGAIDTATGAVQLQLRAEMRWSLWPGQPHAFALPIRALMTTEQAELPGGGGDRRMAGRRLAGGAGELVAVCQVQPTSSRLVNLLLWLPATAWVRMPAEFALIDGRKVCE